MSESAQEESLIVSSVEGPAYVLGKDIDTDQIIPAEHLVYSLTKSDERRMFGRYALSGVPDEAQGLPFGNRPFTADNSFASEYAVIVAGSNFGCGSSREHAPWALVDYGLKAVVSTEIADIFRSNALKNGLLPIVVEERAHRWLLENPGAAVRIDVAASTLSLPSGESLTYPIDDFARYCLLEGIDQLGFLQQNDAVISEFEENRAWKP
jgi:3-isopropylmalate/(R)-2-methylmalate dehydratase small subunit